MMAKGDSSMPRSDAVEGRVGRWRVEPGQGPGHPTSLPARWLVAAILFFQQEHVKTEVKKKRRMNETRSSSFQEVCSPQQDESM